MDVTNLRGIGQDGALLPQQLRSDPRGSTRPLRGVLQTRRAREPSAAAAGDPVIGRRDHRSRIHRAGGTTGPACVSSQAIAPTRKAMTRTRNAVLLGVATTFIFSVASGSQDRAKVVPEMKVLLENDRVRVQFHDVAVGERRRCTPIRRTSPMCSVHIPRRARLRTVARRPSRGERVTCSIADPWFTALRILGRPPFTI